MTPLSAAESAVIREAQQRLDARRAAWIREKSLLGRRPSGDWAFALRPAAPSEGR